jgi:hypothetical protein
VFNPSCKDKHWDAGSWRGINDRSRPVSRHRPEADHFGNCPICGVLLDMRDLTQVLAHVHDAEIEIGEGPEPPAREGPLQ